MTKDWKWNGSLNAYEGETTCTVVPAQPVEPVDDFVEKLQLPQTYNEAKKALAALVRIDEVKDYHDKTLAIETYAYQAKDAELVASATEIRKRAERRIGELIAEQRAAGKLARGARGRGSNQHLVRVADGPAPP